MELEDKVKARAEQIALASGALDRSRRSRTRRARLEEKRRRERILEQARRIAERELANEQPKQPAGTAGDRR